MLAYKFKDIVKEIADEKGVKMLGSHENLVREILHKIEADEITPDQVIDELKSNKDFRMHFSREDFERIKREIK